MIPLFLYILAAICSFFAFNLLGDIILTISKIKRTEFFFTNIFIQVFLGLILSCTFYAIINTYGHTILIIFIPLLLIVYTYLEKVKDRQNLFFKNFFTQYQNYIFCLVLIVLLGIYFGIGRVPSEDKIHTQYFFDSIFYSKVSEYIVLTGYENTSQEANLIANEYKGVAPYHYLELWLNALLSKLFNLSFLVCYEVSLRSLLTSILVISFLACIEHVKKIYFIDLLSSISLLGVAGFYFSFYDILPLIKEYNEMQEFSLINPYALHKIMIITLFLVLFILCLFHKKYQLITYPLISIGIVNFLSIPGFYSSSVLLIIFISCFITKNNLLKILFTILFFLAIISFYLFFSAPLNIFSNQSVTDIIITNFNILDKKINYIIGIFISHLAYYLPFWIILSINLVFLYRYIKKSNNAKILFLLFFFTTIISIIISSAIAGIGNYAQIYTNNITALLYLIPLLILLLLHKKNNLYFTRIYQLFLVVWTSIGFLQQINSQISNQGHYSNIYLQEVKNHLNQIQNPLGLSIYTEIEPDQNGSAIHNSLGGYLKSMKNYYNTINAGTLLLLESKPSSRDIQHRLQLSPFVRYASKKSASFEEHLIRFINEFKIEYLIIAKSQNIPKSLVSSIQKVITDSKTGERFIILSMHK